MEKLNSVAAGQSSTPGAGSTNTGPIKQQQNSGQIDVLLSPSIGGSGGGGGGGGGSGSTKKLNNGTGSGASAGSAIAAGATVSGTKSNNNTEPPKTAPVGDLNKEKTVAKDHQTTAKPTSASSNNTAASPSAAPQDAKGSENGGSNSKRGGGGQSGQALPPRSSAALAAAAIATAASQPNGQTKSELKRGRKSKPPAPEAPPTSTPSTDDTGPTLGKRTRTTTQPFQSVMVEQIQQVVAVSAREKQQAAMEDKVVLYDKGEYLAVRSDSPEDFFLCKALQNVYRSSKRIRIFWLNNEGQKSTSVYRLDFPDTIERETILTNVQLRKAGACLQLPDDERRRALNILERAIRVEKGELLPDLKDPAATSELGLDVSLIKANASGTEDESGPATTKPTPKRKAPNSEPKAGPPAKVAAEAKPSTAQSKPARSSSRPQKSGSPEKTTTPKATPKNAKVTPAAAPTTAEKTPDAKAPQKVGKAEGAAKEPATAGQASSSKKRARKTGRRTQRTHFGGWGGAGPTSESDFDDAFDDELLTSYIEMSAAAAAKRAKERERPLEPGMVFRKGDFLAVRNDFCGFYLCKAQSNIYVSSENIKIQWLNAESDNSNIYVLDYSDTIQKATILTKVEMTRRGRGRLSLSDEERRRAQNLLSEALRLERQQQKQGKSGSSDDTDNETTDTKTESEGRPRRGVAPSNAVATKDNSTVNRPNNMAASSGPSTANCQQMADGGSDATVDAKLEPQHRHESRKRKSHRDKESSGSGKKERREEAVGAGGVRLTIKRGKDAASHMSAVVAQHIINPNIPEMTKDPLWDGPESVSPTEALGFLWSTDCQGPVSPSNDLSTRLAGAVLRGDHATIRSLLVTQSDSVINSFAWQSAHVRRTALDHATLKGDIPALRSLLPKQESREKAREKEVRSPVDLICSFRRETNLLRVNKEADNKGGNTKEDRKESKREGNAALLKDTEVTPLTRAQAVAHAKQLALQRGVPVDVLEELLLYEETGGLREEDALEALANGNTELAVAIVTRLQLPFPSVIQTPPKLPPSSISPLVGRLLGLAASNSARTLSSDSSASSVSESLRLNDILASPLGPNGASAFQLVLAGGRPCLEAVCDLLYGPRFEAVERAIREALTRRDSRGRVSAHYAAAAKSATSLEWLISRGTSVTDVDYEGNSPLHVAAVLGRVECLQLLISLRLREGSSHSHLDDTNRKGQSALHAAIQAEQIVTVQRLLAFGADANKPLGSHSDKVTPLMLAAQRGHKLDILRAVLERTDGIDVQDKRGRSALVHAAMNGHSAAACLLLRRGANAALADGSGNSALHYAAAYGHLHVVKLLVELANLSPAQVNDAKMCSLEVAFRKGHIGIVRYMLDLGCFARGLGGGGGLGERLLSACVTLPDLLEPTMVDRFEMLLRSTASLLTKPLDKANNNNLLHLLVLMQRRIMSQQVNRSESSMREHRLCLFKVMDLILNSDLDLAKKAVAAVNNEGETPVSLALAHGCLEIAARLGKSAPAMLKAALKNECALRRIAIHCATFDISSEMLVGLEDEDIAELRTLAQTLAAQKGVNLLCVAVGSIDSAIEDFASDEEPEAALRIFNACRFLHWLLCELGMEATGPVLHAAVRCRSPQPLQTILESSESVPSLHANIEHRQQGLTPLQEAVLQGKTRAALYLVEHGARTDLMMPPCVIQQTADEGSQPALPLLLFCCLPGQVQDKAFQGELIRKIAEQKTRDLTAIHPVSGDCALHYVVQKRHWEPDDLYQTVDTLLQCGLAALATNVLKQTPLHLAAASNTSGDSRIEAALVNAGAAIDVLDMERRLPLHYLFLGPAGRKDPIELCRLLVPSKASRHIDTVDSPESATALHYAAQAGAALCCRFLLQRNANVEIRNKQGNSAPGLAVLRRHAGATLALIEKGYWYSDEILVEPNQVSTTSAEGLNWRYVCPKKVLPQRKSLLQCVFEIAKSLRDAKAAAEASSASKGANSRRGEDRTAASSNEHGASSVTGNSVTMTSMTPAAGNSSADDSLEIVWGSLISGILIEQLEHKSHPMTLAVDAAVRAQDYPRALKLLSRVKHGWTLTSQKQTVLHLLAQQPYGEGQLELAQALLDREVILQQTDEHGCTALTYANINWNHRLAEFLVGKIGIQAVAELSADLSIRTPLSAIFWNLERQPLPPEMAQLAIRLIRAGSKIDVLSRYPIRNLEFPGTVCVSESLLHVENPMACRISPLILAVCKKNYATAMFLLREGGADPNFNDGQKRTPLMYAIKLNDIEMAKLLLNYKGIDDPSTGQHLLANKTTQSSSDSNDVKVKPAPETPIKKEKEPEPSDNKQDSPKDPKKPLPLAGPESGGFATKPKINLSHQDFFGWTVIHHAVAPLPDVTYVCTDMVRLLARVGAPLGAPVDPQNTQKTFPLHLSAGRGVESITVALQELLGNKGTDPPTKIMFREPVPISDDGVLDSIATRDFRKDALSQRTRANGLEQLGANGVGGLCGLDSVGRIDPLAPLDPQEWEVMRDTATPGQLQPAYDVLLTKLDSHPLVYSFCKLQVAASLDGTRFTLIERSGRVGDSGVAQVTPMGGSRVDAAREFCRRFRERTGANFEEAHTLRPTPGKFRPVLLRSQESGDNKQEFREGGARLDIDGTTGILDAVTKALPSKLATPLQALLKSIIKGCEMAPAVPCSEDGLKEALSLLEEMRQLAAERRQLEATTDTNPGEKDNANNSNGQDLAELLLRLAERSHQLHALLPPPAPSQRRVTSGSGAGGGGRRRSTSCGGVIALTNGTRASPEQLEPLWTEEQIDEQIGRVQVLLDLQLSRQMLRGAVFAAAEVHPLEYVYKATQCRLQQLQVDSTETQTILQYIHNSLIRWRPSDDPSKSSPPPSFGPSSGAFTRPPYTVTGVYRVSRGEEEKQIVSESASLPCGVRNHWLLWKPVGAGGLLAALHRGLQAVPLTGAWREWPQHSRGITFYDRFGQGLAFAEPGPGGSRFALLCQVALGDCVELPSGSGRGPSGSHSARLPGRWTPDARAHISWQSWTVPLGETTLTQGASTGAGRPPSSAHLAREANEYVVYKPQQVCMRYLVEYH